MQPALKRQLKFELSQEAYEQLKSWAARAAVSPGQVASVWVSERLAELSPTELNTEASVSVTPPSRKASTAKSKSNGRRSKPMPASSLHDEIVTVLKERGEPMSVAQIAEEIRRRGQYQPPRSGQPVRASNISSRVSNPHYRSLFERSCRRITLSGAGQAVAAPAAPSGK
jgi:hypothetical protein